MRDSGQPIYDDAHPLVPVARLHELLREDGEVGAGKSTRFTRQTFARKTASEVAKMITAHFSRYATDGRRTNESVCCEKRFAR